MLARPSATPQLVRAFGLLGLTAAVGYLVATSPTLAFGVVLGVMGLLALRMGSWELTGIAVALALTSRGLTNYLGLPGFLVLLELLVVWAVAGISALHRRKQRVVDLPRHFFYLLPGLALIVSLSAVLNSTGLMKPLIFMSLLGVPLALLGALVVERPPPIVARRLRLILLGLIALQIPVAGLQFLWQREPDAVQGLLGSSHNLGAIISLGCIWQVLERRSLLLRVLLIALSGTVLVISDSKQVIVAFIGGVVLLVATSLFRRVSSHRRGVLVAVSLAFLLAIAVSPLRATMTSFLVRTETGVSGKQLVVHELFNYFERQPASILIGFGPGQTVSRTALIASGALRNTDLASMSGIEPSDLSLKLQRQANRGYSTSFSSFDAPSSSAIGLLGDLGLLGLLTYLAFVMTVIAALRKASSPAASAAMVGWFALLILGLVSDWWEQAPFILVLTTMTGIAMSPPSKID